jgi:lysophospholipase L1-like esterase
MAAFAADFAPTMGDVTLHDGDTFVFLGDSITHQCLYTQYVEDYYYTRYPDKRIYFHNAGVSGDRAIDTLRRLEDDVTSFHPKYVSILIGMNDGRYTNFEDEILNTYKKDMTTLLDRLAAAEATAIIMTPTMFDLRPALAGDDWDDAEEAKQIHYNATLSFFGMWGAQQAADRGIGFVNMFEPLNRITREARTSEPLFTLIGDAVHPEADGQLVMALALLSDIGAEPLVSSLHAVRDGRRWTVHARNGSVSDIEDGSLAFTFKASALPWVVPEDAAQGFALAEAGAKMSRETFRVSGLKPGRYELRIDDEAVGVYDWTDLGAGIDLQGNTKTPQYAQAMEVALLNRERNDEVVQALRDTWSRIKSIHYRKARGDDDDEDDEGDGESLEEREARHFGEISVLVKRARKLEDAIYEINQPVAHQYSLVRVK